MTNWGRLSARVLEIILWIPGKVPANFLIYVTLPLSVCSLSPLTMLEQLLPSVDDLR